METDIYTLYRKGITWRVEFEGDNPPKVYALMFDGEFKQIQEKDYEKWLPIKKKEDIRERWIKDE